MQTWTTAICQHQQQKHEHSQGRCSVITYLSPTQKRLINAYMHLVYTAHCQYNKAHWTPDKCYSNM